MYLCLECSSIDVFRKTQIVVMLTSNLVQILVILTPVTGQILVIDIFSVHNSCHIEFSAELNSDHWRILRVQFWSYWRLLSDNYYEDFNFWSWFGAEKGFSSSFYTIFLATGVQIYDILFFFIWTPWARKMMWKIRLDPFSASNQLQKLKSS